MIPFMPTFMWQKINGKKLLTFLAYTHKAGILTEDDVGISMEEMMENCKSI